MNSVLKYFKQYTDAYKKAYVTALNKAARSTVTKVLKELRQTYNISAKDLRKYVHIKGATLNNPTAKIYYDLSGIPLDRFEPELDETTNLGISANVDGNRKTYKHTFFMEMKDSNKVSVFVRTTKKRLPVIRVTGFNLGKIATKDDKFAEFERMFIARYDEVYQHQLSFYLGKIKNLKVK